MIYIPPGASFFYRIKITPATIAVIAIAFCINVVLDRCSCNIFGCVILIAVAKISTKKGCISTNTVTKAVDPIFNALVSKIYAQAFSNAVVIIC